MTGSRILTGVRLALAAMALAALTQTAHAKPSTAERIVEQVGDVMLDYSGLGTSVSVFGIPISRGSTLHAQVPGGANFHYMQEDLYRFKDDANPRTLPDGSRTFSVRHALTGERSGPFEATETLTLRTDNSVTARLEFTYAAETDVQITWEAFRLFQDAFIGMPMNATPASATKLTSAPTELWPREPNHRVLVKGFESVEIDSRFGPVRIEASPADEELVLEYRREAWSTYGPRNLWLTLRKGPKVEKDKLFAYEVTLRFPESLPKNALGSGVSTPEKVYAERADEVQTPGWGSDVIVPAPRSVKYGGARFELREGVAIATGAKPHEGAARAAEFLADEIERLTDVRPKIVEKAPAGGAGVIELAVADGGTTALGHAEGYELKVEPRRVTVKARAEGRGHHHGAATLAQLVRIDKRGAFIRGAEISDYPAMDYRGVHFLSGANAGRQISRAVRELMARYKLNNLVWETQFLKWDSQPDIHHPVFGMDKSDAEQVLETARRSMVDVQPLVHSLGHSEWIFANERNLDICEDPNRPYSYMPANPRTYEFIHAVYGEALEFFKPVREFHIGHDEFDMRGRVPYRSKSLGNTGDLFIYDILKHHEFFSKRGVTMMIWGDLLLAKGDSPDACHAPSPEEAKRRRDALPKDITIVDWHYADAKPEAFKSLGIFKGEGFPVIGAGWYVPGNIRNLAAQCEADGVRGYLQTTWAGFNFEVNGAPENWPQYWAYLLAAEHAWGGQTDNRAANGLPEWDAKELFMDTWFGREPIKKAAAGYTLYLAGARNLRIADDGEGPAWMGHGPQFDLSAFKPGLEKLRGRLFDTRESAYGRVAVLLAGALNPAGEWPSSVVLKDADRDLGPTSELHFLMSATIPELDGTRIGEIIVKTDAGESVVPLVYGDNMFAPEDYRMGHGTWFAWTGRNGADQPIALWDVVWKSGGKPARVKSIEVRSLGRAAAPVLFGVTGVR